MRTPETRPCNALAALPLGWCPAALGLGALAAMLMLAAACALPHAASAGETALSSAAGRDGAARDAELARQERLHEAQTLAARGKKLVASGAYAEAREALREALRLNPADAASRKLLAQAETALGVANGDDVLAHTRERHAFKAQVLRQQIELDLFEGDKALKEKAYSKAVQHAERAIAGVGQVDDALRAGELRERAEKLLAEARAANTAAAGGRRQAQLEQAKAQAAGEKSARGRDQAEGILALRSQGMKCLETKDYDKALAIAEDMLRAAPGHPEALALREKVKQATSASLGSRAKSRERREAEASMMAEIEREMEPPKPNVVLAKDPNRAKARAFTGPLERWELELRSKLTTPVTMEFRETPLAQAIEQLASVSGVNIVLDPDVAATQATVSIPRAKMPLESMLKWVARFGNLQYCLRDGAVFLTGRSGTLDTPVTKMYDVATLLSPPTTAEPMKGPGPIEPGPRPWQVVDATSPDPEPIGRGWADFIRSSIAPQTWDQTLQQKMPYTIQYRNGRIVVVHVPEVQRQVEALLNDFRKSRTLQVHMLGRFITVEKKFLDSLNFSFSFGSGTAGTGDTLNSSMSPLTGVPSLAEFDNYSPSGGLGLRYSVVGDDSLVMLLRAVMHEGKGTVLEAPRLTCYNTQRANIQVLRNRNYIRRVSSDYVPEIGNIPEGTIFDIQPFVSADRRNITLVCQPQMRTFVGFTTVTYARQIVEAAEGVFTYIDMSVQVPTTTLRSIGTTVTVPNGGTIIMGGFTNVQEYTGVATSPFIEGIPLLRTILRGRDHVEGRRTLIMLITAETVDDIFEEESSS